MVSKLEFIRRLSQLLSDIPAEEREDVLRYYEDYFDDADNQTEEEIVEKLGAPEQIARQIKLDLYNKASKEGGVYTENGYTNCYYETAKDAPEVIYDQPNNRQQQGNRFEGFQEEKQYYYNQPYVAPQKKVNVALIVLLVITAPIWGSLAIAAVATVGGVLLGLTFGAGGVFLGLALGGVICLGVGIFKLFVAPLVGLLCMGIGCVLLSIAFLALSLLIVVCSKVLPGVIRGIVALLSRIFHREERVAWGRQ